MSFSNSDDIIDSRDIIARIEELESERETLQDEVDTAEEEDKEAAEEALKEWDESEEATELKALQSLAEDAEGYCPDWGDGATLIRESYFEEYCQELLSDIGDLPRNIPHYIVIDWEATADNIKMDYTEVDFDGVSYFVR